MSWTITSSHPSLGAIRTYGHSIAVGTALAVSVAPATAATMTHFDVSTGAASVGSAHFSVGPSDASSRVGDLVDAVRRAEFLSVHDAIDVLASLDPDEEYFIVPSVKGEGQAVLSLLYMLDLPAPSVFSHDEDTVTFSWGRGEVQDYLTVGEGHVALLHATPNDSIIVGQAPFGDPSFWNLLLLVGDYVGQRERATG